MILRLRSGAGIQEAGVQSWLWGTRANFLTSTPRLPMCSEEANNTFSYLFRTGCGSDCLAKCTIDLHCKCNSDVEGELSRAPERLRWW